MKRSFDLDMDRCPDCGGKMKNIAVIQDPKVINKILKHIGHSTDPPDESKLDKLDNDYRLELFFE